MYSKLWLKNLFWVHLYLVIIIYYAHIKVHFHSSLSTFSTMKVQLYPPLSTIYICECPVLLPNIHFFNNESPVLLPNVHFFIYECPVLHINKKNRYKNFFLFRVRIFLSFCEFYKFGSILNLYFPFPYPSTFSISSCTSISFIISDALDIFSFVTSITSFLPNTESKLNLS